MRLYTGIDLHSSDSYLATIEVAVAMELTTTYRASFIVHPVIGLFGK